MIMMTLMTKEVKRSDALLNFGLMYCKTRPSVYGHRSLGEKQANSNRSEGLHHKDTTLGKTW